MKINKQLAAVIMFMISVLSCGCQGEDKFNVSSEITSPAETSSYSSEISVYSAEKIRENIIGEWGRLEKTMHYFYEDGSCVIGGMQGTYKIEENKSLILTTMSGSVTEYVWASSFTKTDSPNYWYLDGDIITINGNQFTKITAIVESE